MNNPATNRLSFGRSGGLRIRLALTFFGVAFALLAITVSFLYFNAREALRTEFAKRAVGLINIVSTEIDGDIHASLLTPQDAQSPAFKTINERNKILANSDPDIYAIWSGRTDGNGNITFVLDTQEEVQIGEVYEDATEFLKQTAPKISEVSIEPEYYTDGFGFFLTAYKPIYRSTGALDGFIAIDLYANNLLAQENTLLNMALTILGLSIPILLIVGYVFGQAIASPLTRLAEKAQSIATGNFNARADVHGNDEVTALALSFNQMAEQVGGLVLNLEAKVQERTAEMEFQTEKITSDGRRMARRANQLQAIAKVSRGIASINNLQSLLPAIANVISEQFGYYHIGIFLLDADHQYAVLRASNSLGGKRMLAREHKLRVGESGLVGYAARTGQARIALDTGDDAVFFNNPDLPETRSEISLPLRSEHEVIGVLDVQSTEPSAFAADDIEILNILSDQVTIAIQNARLFSETQRSLKESDRIYKQYIRQQWRDTVRRKSLTGVRYNQLEITPFNEATQPQAQPDQSAITVPIKLRDEIVANITVRAPEKIEWDEDELDIIHAIAERVAIAIENVRLLEDSQRRAAKERQIGEIAASISASSSLDGILQTALQNLGLAIPGAQIAIQLSPKED